MYAVVGQISIESGREDESIEFLKANVLPLVKQSPGLIGGYWMAPEDGKGLGVVFYETEEAARGAAGLTTSPRTSRYERSSPSSSAWGASEEEAWMDGWRVVPETR